LAEPLPGVGFARTCRPVDLVHTPDGALSFGYRCWPNDRDQTVIDAMLDGLAESGHYKRGVEVYAVLIDRDVAPGERTHAEAWRVSDGTLVDAGPFAEVALRLAYREQPLTRG
jgi:hypothetical protein